MEITIAGLCLACVEGDITAQAGFDAVVNAANAELRPGGGVAGLIHRAAGPELDRACRPLAPLRPGEAVLTPAFALPNRFVIHCLGPVYGADPMPEATLAACYRAILALAEEHGIGSVATPAISTGIFGYPPPAAAAVAIGAVAASAPLLRHLRLLRFVLRGPEALAAHEAALRDVARRFGREPL